MVIRLIDLMWVYQFSLGNGRPHSSVQLLNLCFFYLAIGLSLGRYPCQVYPYLT